MPHAACWMLDGAASAVVVQFLLRLFCIFCIFVLFSAYGMQHAAGFEVLRRLTRALSSRRLQTSSNSRRCKVHLPQSRNGWLCVSVCVCVLFLSAGDCVCGRFAYMQNTWQRRRAAKNLRLRRGRLTCCMSPLIYADCPPSRSGYRLLASAIRLCIFVSRSVAALRLAAFTVKAINVIAWQTTGGQVAPPHTSPKLQWALCD